MELCTMHVTEGNAYVQPLSEKRNCRAIAIPWHRVPSHIHVVFSPPLRLFNLQDSDSENQSPVLDLPA
jgi:hypothetical protein